MPNPDFWKRRKVLLTGHTGFKGSWTSAWLQRMGADLVGYSLDPPTDPNLFEAAKLADGMESIISDVRDLAALVRVFQEHQPELVIHMAAQPIVRLSYGDPVATFDTNIMGTVNVLEAVR